MTFPDLFIMYFETFFTLAKYRRVCGELVNLFSKLLDLERACEKLSGALTFRKM